MNIKFTQHPTRFEGITIPSLMYYGSDSQGVFYTDGQVSLIGVMRVTRHIAHGVTRTSPTVGDIVGGILASAAWQKRSKARWRSPYVSMAEVTNAKSFNLITG